jgi:hypothetical protein
MIAHAYNPSYSGSGDGKIVVQSQAGQKVTQNPISANKLDLGVHSCHSSHVGEIGRRILLIPAPGKSTRSYLKNNSSNNKRIWYELKNQCESTANAPPFWEVTSFTSVPRHLPNVNMFGFCYTFVLCWRVGPYYFF